ncbi:MAG: PilZ domain [Deltaproteobacteria bacterium]|nr:PilZ domain [Deltaproteobacteria bacterium]
MSIAAWLLPVLWREQDWRAALERFGGQLAGAETGVPSQRAAIELGRASEHIEPDRRRTIAAYELAGPGGDLGRARELAVEIGWWSARARLTLAARTVDPDPRLVLAEAEAWWDAGQPDLCALALAGVRSADAQRADELRALVAARDLQDFAAEAVASAMSTTGAEAADAYVMAARFSRAAGRLDDMTRWLESALVAHPGHGVAASFLLALARDGRDPEPIQRYLTLRLEGADVTTWIDRMRASALALIDSAHHRGFGLRLLRQALERAYESQHPNVPGHLAMWTVLAAHAAADGTRRDLLPLVITALQSSQDPVDRVWLGALATEISLRDAGHAVVAGAYAEIVAEHAPDHPIVRELVAAVAAATPAEDRKASSPSAPLPSVPPAAVAAARLEESADVDVDIDLDETYAEAAEASLVEADLLDDDDDDEDQLFGPKATVKQPAVAASRPAAPPAVAASRPAAPPAVAARSTPAPNQPQPRAPSPATSSTSSAAAAPVAVKPSIAPASLAKVAPPVQPASIIPASLGNPSSMIPRALARPAASIQGPAKLTAAMAPISRVPLDPRPTRPVRPTGPNPVLAALRTVDRPVLPPREPEPADASPRARRILIPIDVHLIRPDGTRVNGHSRDISTSGLFVITDAALAVGDALTIELLLPGEEAFTETVHRSRARVARHADGGYGIELIAPDAALIAALGAL